MLFNNLRKDPLSKSQKVTKEDLLAYEKPSVWQVGHLVDVKVGHIDHFKFHEEYQVDYHMRKAGFLEQQQLYHLKMKVKLAGELKIPLYQNRKPLNKAVVLKTTEEKLHKVKQQKLKLIPSNQPMQNTSKDVINYDQLNNNH